MDDQSKMADGGNVALKERGNRRIRPDTRGAAIAAYGLL